MKPSCRCYEIIKGFEGLRLVAYKDQVGVWTIGYGATFYQDGSKVKKGDKVTQQMADNLFEFHIRLFAGTITPLIKSEIRQSSFDAMVSLAYNIGTGAFGRSTLLKVINKNPENNSEIVKQFMRWNKAKGKVLPELTKRRAKEVLLYFDVIIK